MMLLNLRAAFIHLFTADLVSGGGDRAEDLQFCYLPPSAPRVLILSLVHGFIFPLILLPLSVRTQQLGAYPDFALIRLSQGNKILLLLIISCATGCTTLDWAGWFGSLDIMPVVKKIYNACKESFTPNGPKSEEALEKVRSILDDLKPANVGLDQEAQAVQKWRAAIGNNGKKSRNGSPQCPLPIKYLHIHECENFSIGIFCMPPSSIIPLHNHPGMTVLSKVLYGSLHVKSYDWLDVPGQSDATEARPAKLVKDCEMTAPCGTTVLYPTTGGNIHCFKAVTPCALFDILTPPYSSEGGRHCAYYRKAPIREFPDGIEQLQGVNPAEVVWLEEIQLPENFMVLRGQYKGPVIKKP